MLCASTLAAASSTLMYASAMSPSVNPCVVRVRSCAASPMTGPTRRYRNDPYGAKVLMSPKSLAAFYSQQTPTTNYASAYVQPPTPVATVQQPAYVMPVAVTPVKRTAAPSATRYALVNFKQEAGIFLAPFRISVGDRVVVDGDRGEHVGTVGKISTEQPANFNGAKKIIRRCTAEDMSAVDAKTRRESAATRTVQGLVDTLGLNKVVVHDTELQFDQQKLTIYVRRPSPKTFVDFRKLQRGLFREFRCRIWLAYMDEVEVERPMLE